jgi:hypothetical protein
MTACRGEDMPEQKTGPDVGTGPQGEVQAGREELPGVIVGA